MTDPGAGGGSRDSARRLVRLRRRWREIPGNVRGGIWMILAAALFTVMAALIKLAGKTLHVTEILLFRQAVMMLLALPVILRDVPAAFTTQRPGLQILRIVAAVLAMLLSFTAFIHLPLADAITIAFSRTFFITILAIFILREVVGLRRWSAMIAGFLGVVIVAQPSAAGGFSTYVAMAIAGAACAALVMIIIRIVSQADRPVTILAWQAIGVGALMFPPALWFWKTPSLAELGILAAIGAVSALSQMCNIYAFRAAEASAIAPLDYTRLVWATLLGLLLFADWPGLHVGIGAGVIVAAGLYTMYREQKLGKQRRGAGMPPAL